VNPDEQSVLPFSDSAERLFRSIKRDWVLGTEVTPDAIDLKGCSCYRESIAPDPASAIDLVGRPTENGVASITAGNARGLVPRADGEPWEFYPEHCPQHGNAAHCEILVHRRDSQKRVDQIPRSQKVGVKLAIASKMTIVIDPSPSSMAEPEGDFG